MHEVIKDPNGQHLIALFLNHFEIPTASVAPNCKLCCIEGKQHHKRGEKRTEERSRTNCVPNLDVMDGLSISSNFAPHLLGQLICTHDMKNELIARKIKAKQYYISFMDQTMEEARPNILDIISSAKF